MGTEEGDDTVDESLGGAEEEREGELLLLLATRRFISKTTN